MNQGFSGSQLQLRGGLVEKISSDEGLCPIAFGKKISFCCLVA